MPDREMVLKALRCLSNPFDEERDCDNCSYDFCSCVLDVTADALELLKAQEPLNPFNPLSPHGGGIYFCGKCKSLVGTHDKFCSQCGREVKWDDA